MFKYLKNENKYLFQKIENLLNENSFKTEKNVLITCNSLLHSDYIDILRSSIDFEDIIIVPSNPSLELLKKINILRDKCNLIAIGGGSVIDVAKILFWLFSYKYSQGIEKIFDEKYINKYQKQNKFNNNYKLYIFPSTSGTGSETTNFSTIWDYQNNKKLSFQSNKINLIAYYDVELIKLQTYELLISSLFDALSHSLESIWNINANKTSLKFSYESFKIIYSILKKVTLKKTYLNNNDYKNASYGSYLAGRAISLTQTAVAHSMSYPITLNYNLNHGYSVGFFLPGVLIFNKDKIPNEIKFLLSTTRNNNVENMANDLGLTFKKTGAYEKFFSKVPSYDAIETLINQMINKARSRNNIRNVSHKDIKKILDINREIYDC